MAGQGKGEPRSSARRLLAEDRARRAWDLRLSGLTLRQIANELGYSSEAVALRAVDRYRMKLRAERVPDLDRDVALGRLERLTTILSPALTRIERLSDGTERRVPDFAAIDRYIKVEERRARLQGLDASDMREEEANRILMVQAQAIADLIDGVLAAIGLDEPMRMAGRREAAARLRSLSARQLTAG